jgi:antitoxin ParD1/3/4
MAGSNAFDFYALSCGSLWKTAWNLIETAQRKSQIPNFSYTMSRLTSTMTISLPEDLKQFVKKRSVTAHYGTPSDYIRGLIREDVKRLEQEQLEIELMKGLKGKGIPMTKAAWKRMRAEAAQIIKSKR